MESQSCSIPREFLGFHGYNMPEKSKHQKRDVQNMSAAVLDTHANVLNSLLLQPWFDANSWKVAVCNLADAMSKYTSYLQQQNVKVQEHHQSLVPIRSMSNSESCTFIKRAHWIQPSLVPQYRALHFNTADEFSRFS